MNSLWPSPETQPPLHTHRMDGLQSEQGILVQRVPGKIRIAEPALKNPPWNETHVPPRSGWKGFTAKVTFRP